MSGVWGNNIQLSIFGESHGSGVGITVHGLPAGLCLNMEEVQREMERRSPGKTPLSTARREADKPELLSGIFQGKTTGAPLCCLIKNQDVHSDHYEQQRAFPRPGHSDYPAFARYSGFQDYRGGGHFSGRLTAPLVFAGAICKQLLRQKGIIIGAHIQQIGTVSDDRFQEKHCHKENLLDLQDSAFPLLRPEKEQEMKEQIQRAAAEQDSLGGIIECTAIGLPPGLGAPFFDSVESTLSHLLFSIPAVKGVEFGDGFSMAEMTGSRCSDEYFYDPDGQIQTMANHNGGILGGLTTGMPLIFRVVIKPTPSIGKEQRTVDLDQKTDTALSVKGRHDPCIVPRAVPVVEAVCAIGLCQFIQFS